MTLPPATSWSNRDFRVGFFDDPNTEAAIRSMCAADYVTFFAGAGVSADQQIPVWPALVRSLLEGHLPAAVRDQIVDFPGAGEVPLSGAIVSAYFQLPMASAVDQMFEENYPGEGANARNAAIHAQLYGKGTLVRVFDRKPSFAYDLLRTAITLRACGKQVHIITTNYDGILEEIAANDPDIRRMLDDFALSVKPYAPHPVPSSGDDEIPVVHIHGYIPRNGAPRSVVFSEPDYVRWMEDSNIRSYLYSRFNHGHTLIVGASLRDYNIVAYLRETQLLGGAKRFAVLPVQGDPGLSISKRSPDLASLLTAIREKRGQQLGIQILAPDYYGQVRQFLIEISLGAASASGTYTEKTYKDRIRKWREGFQSVYSSSDSREAATTALKGLARRLSTWIVEAQHVKCELWVRQDIEGRCLELWAESHVVWMDPSDPDYWPHIEPITLDSDSPAVLAFHNRLATEGRVTNRRPGRWTHFVAMPIVLASVPHNEIPVGIIVALMNCPTVPSQDQLQGVRSHIAAIEQDLMTVGTELLKW